MARYRGRAGATISCDLRRNSARTRLWSGGYEPVRAQRLAERRRRWDCRFKLERQPDLRDQVRDGLATGWSTEQIVGRLTREHGRTLISPGSICRFIYHRSAQKDYWHRLLPRAKHRRGHSARQGGSMVDIIKQRRPLSERSPEAADRNVPGHWEAAFMLLAGYGQSILLAHERASRVTLLHRREDPKARRTANHLAAMLDDLPETMRRSITCDNGPEFALHHPLADQTGIQTFFCDVRSPWQKGGIENAIGRIRRSLPRKSNLDDLGHAAILSAAHRYNHTPRKWLDFLTPAEAFLKFRSTVALQT